MTVSILAYGAGNVASVRFAFERLGATVELVSTPEAVASATRLVLPGVGAAGYAMRQIEALGVVEAICAFPRPLLGVCLGQQLLFDESVEDGGVRLLGLIPGRVEAIEPAADRPVPHMGWSRLSRRADHPLIDGVKDGDWAYFVHGFVCPDGPATLAAAEYGGPVPGVVAMGSRMGCQFHPERSSDTGLRILKNFLELPA